MFDRIIGSEQSPYHAYIGNYFAQQVSAKLSEKQQTQFCMWYSSDKFDYVFNLIAQLSFGEHPVMRLESPILLVLGWRYPDCLDSSHV